MTFIHCILKLSISIYCFILNSLFHFGQIIFLLILLLKLFKSQTLFLILFSIFVFFVIIFFRFTKIILIKLYLIYYIFNITFPLYYHHLFLNIIEQDSPSYSFYPICFYLLCYLKYFLSILLYALLITPINISAFTGHLFQIFFIFLLL